MAKAAQSTTAMWRIACQVRHEVGPGTFFKQIFFARMYFNFFYREENQNWTKLHGRLSYL